MDHNELKLSVLSCVFDEFLSAREIAHLTYLDSLGIGFEQYLRNLRTALWRYRHKYTHPYVISKQSKKGIVYRANEKGKMVCCELFYRKMNGIDLNWKHGRMHIRTGKGRYRYNKYNIKCAPRCDICGFNPRKYRLAEDFNLRC